MNFLPQMLAHCVAQRHQVEVGRGRLHEAGEVGTGAVGGEAAVELWKVKRGDDLGHATGNSLADAARWRVAGAEAVYVGRVALRNRIQYLGGFNSAP